MKQTKTITLICLLLLSSIQPIKAAKPAKKSSHYIKGISWSFFGDLGQTKSFAAYSGDQRDTAFIHYEKTRAGFGFSILSLGMNNHFIIKEFNSDKSISLNVHPVLGFGFTRSRLFNLTVPVSINYNLGAVATYDTKKEIGLTVGIGFEYVKAGLVPLKENFNLWESGEYEYFGFASKLTNLLHPAVNIGVRYFTHGGHAQELNFKYGMMSSKVYDQYGKMPLTEKQTALNFWCRLSYTHFIRY